LLEGRFAVAAEPQRIPASGRNQAPTGTLKTRK
jgi:hypothetical protein